MGYRRSDMGGGVGGLRTGVGTAMHVVARVRSADVGRLGGGRGVSRRPDGGHLRSSVGYIQSGRSHGVDTRRRGVRATRTRPATGHERDRGGPKCPQISAQHIVWHRPPQQTAGSRGFENGRASDRSSRRLVRTQVRSTGRWGRTGLQCVNDRIEICHLVGDLCCSVLARHP